MPSTTIATTTLAKPNESGECFAIPWFRTSHGERPSFDSRMRTIASAKRRRPKTRLAARATMPPRMRGCVFVRGRTG
jgi:hypothetical protein